MTMFNATQRAIRRIEGADVFAPFILSPAAQAYVICLALPTTYRLVSLWADLSAGTVTGNVQSAATPGGSPASISGLSAIAITATPTLFIPTADGSEYLAAGSLLQITLSAPSGAANLSLSLALQRQ